MFLSKQSTKSRYFETFVQDISFAWQLIVELASKSHFVSPDQFFSSGMLCALQRRALEVQFEHAAKTGYNRRDEQAIKAITMLIQKRIAVICSSEMIDLGWQLRHFPQ